jgi:6-phosphogluconolactonase
MTTIVNVIKCGTPEESKSQLAKVIQKSVDEHKGSFFTVGLSGGSLPSILSEVLPNIKTDWKKWKFLFCDERIVSFSDPESTFGAYKSLLVTKIPDISLSQFVTIDPSLKTSDAAFDYLSKMKQIFKRKTDSDLPRFDILFLGMGPDGHTCSLFPNHPLLKVIFDLSFSLKYIKLYINVFQERNLWVAPITDSPKVCKHY